MLRWSKRSKHKKKRNYVSFSGTAYPKVLKGNNPTTEVKASVGDDENFYRDPAVMLSDADLDDFNGTEGAPICVEHDREAGSVGVVKHSWISDSNGRGLKVIGRVYTEDEYGNPDERGQKVAKKLLQGDFKGLSVGYGMGLVDNSWGTTNLTSKTFRELSLCEQPFFDKCLISVAASKEKVFKTLEYKSRDSFTDFTSAFIEKKDNSKDTGKFFVKFTKVMASQQNQTPSSEAQAPTQSAEAQPPAAGHGDMPQADARELLKQTEKLNDENEAKAKAMADMEARLKEAEEALKAKDAENEYFRNQDNKRRKEYEEEHKSEYEEYIKNLEDARGSPLTKEAKDQYYATFTNPDFAEGRTDLWSMYQHQVSVAASAKKKEDELAAKQKELDVLLAKNKELNDGIGKATEKLVNAHKRRDEIVSTLTPEQEAKNMEENAATRKTVNLNASRRTPLEPGQMMAAAPSDNERPFLAAYGYGRDADVNASGNKGDEFGYKPVNSRRPMQLYEPRVPSVLYDEDTMEGSVPDYSARNFESGKRLFAWMADPSIGLARGNLVNMVSLVASRNTITRKDATEWEAKRRMAASRNSGN